LTKLSRRTTTKKTSAAESTKVKTMGEILADDSVIEVVDSEAHNRLNLLLWNGHQKMIAPEILYDKRLYQVPKLHETIQRAILFPKNASDYGTAQQLFSQTLDLFEKYIGLARPEAALMTAWTNSTWFSDCLASPPLLEISGVDMSHAITFFRLLRCLCRRPLMLGDINQAALHSLSRFQPTLLINRPNVSPKIRDIWESANYRGMYVFGAKNRLFDVVGSKAIFSGIASESDDQALHVALAPADPRLPRLDWHRQAEIANRLQPQFLMYRLLNFRKVREFRSPDHQAGFLHNLVAHNLLACTQGGPAITQEVARFVQRQEQDATARRTWDPNAAMVEVMWALLHQKSKEASPTEIAKLTNALLRSRGELLEYNAVEVGWKLKQLGLYRNRGANSMVLRFSRDTSRRVHLLAKHYGLSLTGTKDCPDCELQDDVMQ
jgi:uncharacterized protein (DUF2267 family)